MKFAHVVYVTAILGVSRATRSAFETNIANCGGVIIGGNELAPVTCFDSGPDAIDLSSFFKNSTKNLYDFSSSDLQMA